MKHLFYITTLLLLSLTMNVTAQNNIEDINLQIRDYYHDKKKGQEHKPQSPVRVPKVQQDGNSLILSSGCDNCLLEVFKHDESENVIFTEYITPDTGVIFLPEYLSGEYGIRLTRGNISFVGNIFIL